MSVLLIAETNWLENLVLVQDSTSAYLMRLARTEKIDIAVPEYSFYEADGSLNRKLIKRAERIDEALSLLGQISQTEHYAELCEIGRDSLKELKRLTLSDRAEIKRVLDEIKAMIRIIPYTGDASTMAEMMFESASPPFKEGDCRIYASILVFVEHIEEEYNPIIFYTEDKEDFEHPEIRVGLGNLGVEIMFDSGACVARIKG
ncbi:hypothetical protein ES705_21062 [subsurface metagenome]